jgi:endogenous inhibitor of DNA gyrase (YacG/DUF329 family)
MRDVTCPFCGAHGAIDTLNRANGTPGVYRVQCPECGSATRWFGTAEAAWAAWGIRIAQKKLSILQALAENALSLMEYLGVLMVQGH